MLGGASDVAYFITIVCNSFNKTEAAIFPMQTMLSVEFPFLRLNNKRQHVTFIY